MNGQSPSDVVSHDVTQTCSYTRWASKEILCDRNYMEVGHFTLIIPLCVCGVLKKNNKALFFFFLKRCQTTWLYLFHKLKLRGTHRKTTQSSTPFLMYVYHSYYSCRAAKFAVPCNVRNEHDYFPKPFPPGIWWSTWYLEDDVLHSRAGVNGAEGGWTGWLRCHDDVKPPGYEKPV